MGTGDLEVVERPFVVRALLRKGCQCIGHFDDRRLAGPITGEGDVGIAPRILDGVTGVVDATDSGEGPLPRDEELLFYVPSRQRELIARGVGSQLSLPLFGAANAPVEDGDVERCREEIARMLPDDLAH